MTDSQKDDALRSAYARLLARRAASTGGARDEMLPLEAIVALVEQRGSDAERLRTLDRVMSSGALRREFDELRAAAVATRPELPRGVERDAAREDASAEPNSAPRVRTFPRPWQFAAAAMLILGVGVGSWLSTSTHTLPSGDRVRGAAEAPAPLTAKSVADSVQLAWHSVPAVREYQLELLSDSGTVVAMHTTRDTTLMLSNQQLRGARNAWVRAVGSDGTSRSSAAIALPTR